MNHRHLWTVLKLSLAAAVVAAIGVSQAHALDSKIYPGLECVNRHTTGTLVYDEAGTARNSSTSAWLHVGCPVIRDNGFTLTSGWVEVLDLNSTQVIECRFIRAARSGTTRVKIYYSFPRNSSGPATVAWGDLSELGPPGLYSHYILSCIIPPAVGGVSRILSYQATGN